MDPQAPLSLGFSRQEHWSGWAFPSPGHLPDPGMEPASLTSPALAGGLLTTSTTWGPLEWLSCRRALSYDQTAVSTVSTLGDYTEGFLVTHHDQIIECSLGT